jgi:hypothetical protein
MTNLLTERSQFVLKVLSLGFSVIFENGYVPGTKYQVMYSKHLVQKDKKFYEKEMRNYPPYPPVCHMERRIDLSFEELNELCDKVSVEEINHLTYLLKHIENQNKVLDTQE